MEGVALIQSRGAKLVEAHLGDVLWTPPGDELFYSAVRLHGGPAPVRRFLPELIDLTWNRTIDPGKVSTRLSL